MLLMLVCVSSVAFAEGEPKDTTGQTSAGDENEGNKSHIFGSITILAGCFGAAGCAIGGGIAISRLASACIESMARQPEAAGSMFMPMIIAAGMIEGAILFAIVVCIMAVLA